jgi:hypothetical protein
VKALGVLYDVDDLAATLRAELNSSCDEGEQCVVAATTDSGAGVEVCSALANDDFSGLDDLAAVTLYTEVLGIRVATITSG